jgi:hypothetical protein
MELANQQINIEKPGKLTGWNPGFRDCVNDDSTSDEYGDTCSSWYDANDYPGSYGCEGNYNDDDNPYLWMELFKIGYLFK